MARTVRNPLELRTPVRTISSVMRNAPRQQFRPTQLDFGDGFGQSDRGGQGNLTSVTRAPRGTTAGGAPVSGGVTSPVSRGTTAGAPVARVQTGTSRAPQAQAKPAVTSTIKSPAVAAKTTTPAAKPAATKTTTAVKAPVAAKTTTTKAPVAAKTTTPVAKTPVAAKTTTTTKPATTTTTKPTSSLTSTLKNAAIGAGTAALVNKLIGSPKTPVVKPPVTPPVTPKSPVVNPPVSPKPPVVKPPVVPPKLPVSPPVTSVVKPPVTTKPSNTAVAKAATTAAATKGVTGTTGTLTDEEVQAELDRARDEGATGLPEGAVENEDGTYSVTADGMTTTYAADGSIIGMEATTDTTGTDTTATGSDATAGMTDLGEGYFADADGNIYGADGNLMYTVGANGEYVDANATGTNTATAEETTWTDPDTGLTWNKGEDGTWSQEGLGTEEEITTWDDPDTGLTWNKGADGQWTQEGFEDVVDDTVVDDTVVDDTVVDDGSVDDYSGYVDDGTDYEELDAKGGSIPSKRYFDDGGSTYSDTTEEVQDFQNVGYNYGEEGDPTLTGYTLTGNSNPVGNTYARSAVAPMSQMVGSSSMNGVDVNFSDNGDGTASYWDGDQYVTVDSDTGSELFRTDADGNVVDSANIPSTSSTGGWNDNGDGTYSRWDGDQYVTVDGETNTELLRTDSEGNPVTAPVGSITSSGAGNKPSFATTAANAAVNQKQPDQTGILDSLLNAVRDNPGLAGGAVGALIASLMDQAGDSDSAGTTQPVDISELTSFNPRTTDFGAGMVGGRTGTGSPIVSYSDYSEGVGDEIIDDRLYSDLGISGYLREPDMNNYRDEEGNLTDQSGNLVDEYGYLLEDGGYEEEPQEEYMTEDMAEEEPAMAGGGTTHYTFGRVMNPAENLGLAEGMKKGGLSQAHTVHSHQTNPVVNNRVDFRKGSAVNGAGDGQSDDIPAWLADGEYVMDAELVSMLGNGSNKAGAKVLDKFREDIRAHKRSAPLGKIPPKAKSPLNYLKESMNG